MQNFEQINSRQVYIQGVQAVVVVVAKVVVVVGIVVGTVGRQANVAARTANRTMTNRGRGGNRQQGNLGLQYLMNIAQIVRERCPSAYL